MAQQEFRRGSPVELSADGGDACTLSVVVDSDARWRVELIATMKHGGARTVGYVRTCPAVLSGAPTSRVIAAACLPGVRSWSVRARCLGASNAKPLTLEVETANSVASPSFVDLETRRTSVLSGVSGPVNLETGQRLVSIAAAAGGVAANFTVDGEAPVTVPVGLTVKSDFKGRYGSALVFNLTTSYLIEVEG